MQKAPETAPFVFSARTARHSFRTALPLRPATLPAVEIPAPAPAWQRLAAL